MRTIKNSTFTALSYIFATLAKAILGMDKASLPDQIAKGKELIKEDQANPGYIASLIEGITDWVLKAEAYQACELYNQYEQGYVQLPVYIDECNSGVNIINMLYRDVLGMIGGGIFCIKEMQEMKTTNPQFGSTLLGYLTSGDDSINVDISHEPGNLYQVTLDMFKSKYSNMHLSKKKWKEAMIPYYYGGLNNVVWVMTEVAQGNKKEAKKLVEEFENLYATFLPKAYQFRSQCREAWNPEAVMYGHTLPDGFEARMPVTGLSKPQRINIGGVNTSIMVEELQPRDKGEDKTLGIGARIIHSLDAYIMRELHRYAHMSLRRAKNVVKHTKPETNKIEELNWESYIEFEPVAKVIKAFEETGVLSNRIFYVLEDCAGHNIELPSEVYFSMLEMLDYFPETEYDMISIHDEFGVLPSKVNGVRQQANYIYASLYRGNLCEYFNKEYDLDMKANEYNPEVFNMLLDAQYILA